MVGHKQSLHPIGAHSRVGASPKTGQILQCRPPIRAPWCLPGLAYAFAVSSKMHLKLEELDTAPDRPFQRRRDGTHEHPPQGESGAHPRRLEKALNTMHLGVTITDTGGRIIFTNDALTRMHGYRARRADRFGREGPGVGAPEAGGLLPLGRTLQAVRPDRREPRRGRTESTTSARTRTCVRTDRSSPFPSIRTSSKTPSERRSRIVTTWEDITDRKEALEAHLLHDSLHDRLTELQPGALPGPSQPRPRAGTPRPQRSVRGALPRRRPLQDDQRQCRAHGGRPAPRRDRCAPLGLLPGQRHVRAVRRRRVHGAPRRPRIPRGSAACGRAHHEGHGASVRHRWSGRPRLREHRDHHGVLEVRTRGGRPQGRRHRHVPSQGERPRRHPGVRPRDARAGRLCSPPRM